MVQKTANITRHCEEPRRGDEANSLLARRLLRALRALAMTVFVLGISVCPAFAESSVNIPVHHWAYDALDTLAINGLADSCGLTTKPITRMDAARMIETAIYRIQDKKVEFSPFNENRISRLEDMLDKLIKEFRPELLELGVTSAAENDAPAKNLRFKLADPIYTQSIYANVKKTGDMLYENQRGLHLKDGLNYKMRIAGWVEYDNFLAIALEPAIKFAKDTKDFYIETGYVKLSYWNIEIEAGRDTLWWGPGYHGSMLLSDNTYPLDLVKIKSAHPFMLPWEKLGKWNIDFFVARLDKDRDYSYAKLGGIRLECTPFDRLTLGFSRTAIFGGRGRPGLGLKNYVNMFLGRNELNQDVNANASDQLSSFDFKLNIFSNTQVYGEWAGEDKFAPWENEAPGFLAGLLLSDIFNIETLDLRTEYAKTDAAWYKHGIYTSGYRYKSDVLGHHMGGDADDFFMRLSKNFSVTQDNIESFTLGGQFDYETHGRSSAYPEHKYEAGIDTTFNLTDSKSVKLLYEYEAYSNFNNISGDKIHNNILEAEANIRF